MEGKQTSRRLGRRAGALLLLAVVAVGALAFNAVREKGRYISETVSADFQPGEEMALVSDFSGRRATGGFPDGLWIKRVDGEDGAEPVTFVLARAEKDGDFAPYAQRTLELNEKATFRLPDRQQFRYKLYAKQPGQAESVAVKLSLNDYEVIS